MSTPHSFVSGHLVCIHVLPVGNTAAMNTGVKISLSDPDFKSFGYLKLELLTHMVVLC